MEVMGNLFMLLWRAWSVRNSVLRAGKKISIDSSVVFLTCYMDSLMQCRQNSFQVDNKGKSCGLVGRSRMTSARQEKKKWVPPDPGWMKINVDGGFLA